MGLAWPDRAHFPGSPIHRPRRAVQVPAKPVKGPSRGLYRPRAERPYVRSWRSRGDGLARSHNPLVLRDAAACKEVDCRRIAVFHGDVMRRPYAVFSAATGGRSMNRTGLAAPLARYRTGTRLRT